MKIVNVDVGDERARQMKVNVEDAKNRCDSIEW